MALFSTQKLEERTAGLKKKNFATSEDRNKWAKVLTLEVMSSEESGTEDGQEVLFVRPLPWRALSVKNVFDEIDRQNLAAKSPQSRRQTKRRVTGESSSRPRTTLELPQWAFAK